MAHCTVMKVDVPTARQGLEVWVLPYNGRMHVEHEYPMSRLDLGVKLRCGPVHTMFMITYRRCLAAQIGQLQVQAHAHP